MFYEAGRSIFTDVSEFTSLLIMEINGGGNLLLLLLYCILYFNDFWFVLPFSLVFFYQNTLGVIKLLCITTTFNV